MRFLQILSSLTFVVLYVWGTYSTPKPFSWRYNLDIALCGLFATEWLWRLVVRYICMTSLFARSTSAHGLSRVCCSTLT